MNKRLCGMYGDAEKLDLPIEPRQDTCQYCKGGCYTCKRLRFACYPPTNSFGTVLAVAFCELKQVWIER